MVPENTVLFCDYDYIRHNRILHMLVNTETRSIPHQPTGFYEGCLRSMTRSVLRMRQVPYGGVKAKNWVVVMPWYR